MLFHLEITCLLLPLNMFTHENIVLLVSRITVSTNHKFKIDCKLQFSV